MQKLTVGVTPKPPQPEPEPKHMAIGYQVCITIAMFCAAVILIGVIVAVTGG